MLSFLRISVRGLLACAALGIALAAVILSIALEHNPQGEFYGPHGIVWDTVLPLSASYFILGTSAALSVYVAFKMLFSQLSGK